MYYLVIEPGALDNLLPTEGRYEVEFQTFSHDESGSQDFSLLRSAAESDQLILVLPTDRPACIWLIPPAEAGSLLNEGLTEWKAIQNRAAKARYEVLKSVLELLQSEGVSIAVSGFASAEKRPTYGEQVQDTKFYRCFLSASELKVIPAEDSPVRYSEGDLRTYPTTGDSIVILRTDFKPEGLTSEATLEEEVRLAAELLDRQPWAVCVSQISVAQVVKIGKRLDE